ncbi:MAG TPA: nitroreductase family deazaflavin-dependent oxidoreductase [Candidatus Dormibacteraeota bacterium]|nr:nitroreductase family deazaflavin-dependent oxidoreductase [Candidatus Dormibacteraeota bacterium]
MLFEKSVLDAISREREVTLTTEGRSSGKARPVVIWIGTDGRRVFIRSGGGLERQWPQNLIAAGEGTLRVGRKKVSVKPRHVSDPAEARRVSQLYREKYGSYVKPSKANEPLTQGEKATFELAPAS